MNSNLVLLMAVGELLNFDACKLQLKLIPLVTPCYVNYIMFLSRSWFRFPYVLIFLFLLRNVSGCFLANCSFSTNGEHKMHA